MNQTHLFSLFYDELSTLIKSLKHGGFFLCNDTISDRITRILRLQTGDKLILFDHKVHVELELIIEQQKRSKIVSGIITKISHNATLKPEVIICPGLLKKPSFEEIYYVATQMGATAVQPLLTQKVQREWGGKKEQDRLHLIAIAAAEQSRQFILPNFEEPLKLALKKFPPSSPLIKKIYFEIGMKPCAELAQELIQHKFQTIFIALGGEGGFTSEDLKNLHEQGFEGYALTPTVLRSMEAVTVGLGLIRSLAKS